MSRLLRQAIPVAAALLLAPVALAGTPAFFESLDGRNFPGGRIPTTFPAQVGTAYVYAPAGARLVNDPTCDVLSTDVMRLESTVARGGWDARFVHQDGPGGVPLGEHEIMAMKMGQERTDVWGVQAGFSSTDGFEVIPVQLGPALPTDPDQSLGRVYLFGAPTDLRYGNVFDSVCSGMNQVNHQVNVEFTLYGLDQVYFVDIDVLGPTPARLRSGPYPLPAQFSTGYGACMARCMAGTGMAILDGVECIAQATPEIDPIESGNATHRESGRRTR